MSIEKIHEYVYEYGRNKHLRRVLIFFKTVVFVGIADIRYIFISFFKLESKLTFN